VTQLGHDVREMFREQADYRELLYRMTARDLLLRYKQTAMGFAWAVFMPLINTVVFSIVFTQVAKIDTPVPYPLYAYCGLAAWNFFASSLRFAVTSLTGNGNLVSKVYFPREIFPFSAVIVCLVDFGVSSILLAVMMTYYGVWPGVSILFLPVVLLIQIMFTAGIALLLSMANLFYRDVKYLFELIITVWMFASSVLYPLDQLQGRLAMVAKLNPMTAIIDGYRAALFGLPLHSPATLAGATLLSALTLLAAWVVFHRSEYRFAENL